MTEFRPLLATLNIKLFANTREATYSVRGSKGTAFKSSMLSEKLSLSTTSEITTDKGRIASRDVRSLKIWFPTNVRLNSVDIKLQAEDNPKNLPDIAVFFNKRNMMAAATKAAAERGGVTPVAVPTGNSTVADFVDKTKQIIDITQKNINLILKLLFSKPITLTLYNNKYIVKHYEWLRNLYPPYGYEINISTDPMRPIARAEQTWPGVNFIGHAEGATVKFRAAADGRVPYREMSPSPESVAEAEAADDPALTDIPVPSVANNREGVIVSDTTAAGRRMRDQAGIPLHMAADHAAREGRPPDGTQWVKLTNRAQSGTGPEKGTIWAVPNPRLEIMDAYPTFKSGENKDEDSIVAPKRNWGPPGSSEEWWKQQLLTWARARYRQCRLYGLEPERGGLWNQSRSGQLKASEKCSLISYPTTRAETRAGISFTIICQLTLVPDNEYHETKVKNEKARKQTSKKKKIKERWGEKCRGAAAELREINRGRKNPTKLVGGTRRRGTQGDGVRGDGVRGDGARGGRAQGTGDKNNLKLFLFLLVCWI